MFNQPSISGIRSWDIDHFPYVGLGCYQTSHLIMNIYTHSWIWALRHIKIEKRKFPTHKYIPLSPKSWRSENLISKMWFSKHPTIGWSRKNFSITSLWIRINVKKRFWLCYFQLYQPLWLTERMPWSECASLW